jgi:tripartite ATP-independent transporter DctM subunit
MNPIVVGIIGILLLFILLGLRMQIGFAMALVGFLGFFALNSFEAGIAVLGIQSYKTAAHYTLSVIPLFLLMGQFANHSKMGSEVYDMLYRWIGSFSGGLSMATVGACACFAAISGSSLATAAMFGTIALPEMQKMKYSDSLATGCIAAGATLGILIPPSSVLILYGILTEQSISKLFIAGMIPGIALALLFVATIFVMTKIRPEMGAPGPKFPIKEKIVALKSTFGLVALFVLVIGGLYTGWLTPTEAAGVGAFGALVVMILKKRFTWTNLVRSLRDSAGATAMIFGILIGAMIFQYFITLSQIPDQLAQKVVGLTVSRYVILSLIIGSFIVLGCFMEGLSIMVLAVPIVFPIIVHLGFDPIWFGIIITLTMEMSLITPPVGVNVFVLSGVARGIPMNMMFRGILPFWFAMLVCIILLVIFPEIVMFLPNSMN